MAPVANKNSLTRNKTLSLSCVAFFALLAIVLTDELYREALFEESLGRIKAI